MTGRQMLGFVAGMSICMMVSTAAGQRFNHNSYLRQRPPEIKSERDDWLGWQEKVTLARLKGKVVWLQFNF